MSDNHYLKASNWTKHKSNFFEKIWVKIPIWNDHQMIRFHIGMNMTNLNACSLFSPTLLWLQGSKSVKIYIYVHANLCISSALKSRTLSNFTCSKYIYRSKWVGHFWLVKALSCTCRSKWQSTPVNNAPVCTVGSTVKNSQLTDFDHYSYSTCHKRSATLGVATQQHNLKLYVGFCTCLDSCIVTWFLIAFHYVLFHDTTK